MDIFQGGMPVLHRNRQRGTGFFSTLKRILLPVAKRFLPHVAGTIADIASGGDVGTAIKKRVAKVGTEILGDIVDKVGDYGRSTNSEPPPKRRRKQPTPTRKNGGGPANKMKRNWR